MANAQSGGGGFGFAGPRRNLDDVLCFKVSLLVDFENVLSLTDFGSVVRRAIMPTTARTGTCQAIVVGLNGDDTRMMTRRNVRRHSPTQCINLFFCDTFFSQRRGRIMLL